MQDIKGRSKFRHKAALKLFETTCFRQCGSCPGDDRLSDSKYHIQVDDPHAQPTTNDGEFTGEATDATIRGGGTDYRKV